MVLLGTSGCGKTTTLRMINRLVEPSSGSIIVNGKDVLGQSPEALRQGIGYVLQHNGLFPHYTISENIAIVPSLLKWDKAKVQSRTTELLEKLKLSPVTYANKYPAQLSGGEQQRVGLARALAANAPILLMDEPFGALDPVTRTAIRKDFSQLDEFKKKTIVLVTHDVPEAFELADRICLMDKGLIVQVGTPSELLFKPATKFVSSFLDGNRLTLELQATRLKDIFHLLPASRESAHTIYPNEKTLWNVLEDLSGKSIADEHTSGTSKDGVTKLVDITSLMSAYSQYKSTLHG